MKYARIIGLVSAAAMLLLNRFAELPLLSGFFAGAAILCLALALFPGAAAALRRWKNFLFRRA